MRPGRSSIGEKAPERCKGDFLRGNAFSVETDFKLEGRLGGYLRVVDLS